MPSQVPVPRGQKRIWRVTTPENGKTGDVKQQKEKDQKERDRRER
jgi:hypothetical protein